MTTYTAEPTPAPEQSAAPTAVPEANGAPPGAPVPPDAAVTAQPVDNPPAPPVEHVYVEPSPDTEASTGLATVEAGTVALADQWEHDFLEFMGDKLGIRKPTSQALSALSLASGKYVPNQMRNDLIGLFVVRHLSPDSYGQVFSRLMNPDEQTYTVETVGELVRAIIATSDDVAE